FGDFCITEQIPRSRFARDVILSSLLGNHRHLQFSFVFEAWISASFGWLTVSNAYMKYSANNLLCGVPARQWAFRGVTVKAEPPRLNIKRESELNFGPNLSLYRPLPVQYKKMVSVTLVNCNPEGITFLSDVLQSVNDILGDAGLPSTKLTEMNSVKSLLSKALEMHRRSVDDEPQNPSERECSARDSEHINEKNRVEEWEFGRLCKWILHQIQASDLEENGKCREIIDMLEARYKLTDPKTAKCASTQAQQEDTPQVGSHPDFLSDWASQIDRDDERFMFTSLTKLALRVINGNHDRTLCPTWVNFPSLRELWIQGCWSRGWVGPGDPFPPTLQRLRLSKVSPVYLAVLLNALDGVLGLVDLVMEDFALDPGELFVPETGSRVTLDFLEELEFVNFSIADINIISRYVSTPNLSTLSITSSGPSDGIADFLLPFSDHHPQLSSLCILGFNLELGGLKQALHNLINLTHLRICAFGLTDDDLALLKEGTLFPRLTVVIS
ncbi:hypothetical protein M407DRAFT_211056, partial [Tulasnella calospora MUT 4182]